tara:strand:- start:2524 stop:3165 length:642 start_codon:yes stop_codon:yes gene_type:complete
MGSQTPATSVAGFSSVDPAGFADEYFAHLTNVLGRIDRREVGAFIETLLDARERGARVFFIGNGGSAATASHFANDIAIGSGDYDRPFRAQSLTDNVAVLTALGNDFGYEEIFVRQLRVLAEEGDVVVAISASGNSPNLVMALEYAAESGLRSVALTAFDGGRIRAMADQGVHVPTDLGEYGPAEDAHMVLDHLIGAFLMRVVRSGQTDGTTR